MDLSKMGVEGVSLDCDQNGNVTVKVDPKAQDVTITVCKAEGNCRAVVVKN